MSLNTGFSFAGAVPLRSDSGRAVLSGKAGQTAGAAFEAALQEVGAGSTPGVSGGAGAGGSAGAGTSVDTGTSADARPGVVGRALIGWYVPITQSAPAERVEGEALPSPAPCLHGCTAGHERCWTARFRTGDGTLRLRFPLRPRPRLSLRPWFSL